MSDGRLPARRRWVGWAVGLAIILLALALGWVLIRGYGALSELQSVRSSVAQLRTALTDREFDRAERIAPRIAEHASTAHDLTSDPVWRGIEFIPWLGANFTAVREIAEVTDDVATDAVTPIVRIARDVDLVTAGYAGSRVDLAPLHVVSDPLVASAAALSLADSRAQQIDADSAFPPLADAVHDARDLIHDAAATVGALSGSAQLLPSMLGNAGPRNLLIAVQNNAALRSNGGAVATLMLVRADQGVLSIVRTVNARDFPVLDTPLALTPPWELDAGTIALFGDAPSRSVSDATMLPDFPSTGAMLAQRWQQQFGETIDAVIAVDLITARHLVGATGDVAFGTFTAGTDTIVPILSAELPSTVADAAQRDAIFAQAATAVLSALLATDEPPDAIKALAAAAADDRIRIWSAHPEEQKLLAASSLGGTIPVDDERGLTVGVLFNDATNGMMDVYTDASIHTAVGTCEGQPTTQVSVTWTNDAPAELPLAVTGSSELEPGSIRTLIAIFGPEGATVQDHGDGEGLFGTRPVVQHDVTLARGESVTVTASFTGTGAGERLTHLRHTPMLTAPEVAKTDIDCG